MTMETLTTHALRAASQRRSMNGRKPDPALIGVSSHLADQIDGLAELATMHRIYQLRAGNHPNSDPGRGPLMVTVIGYGQDIHTLRDALTATGWRTVELEAWPD